MMDSGAGVESVDLVDLAELVLGSLGAVCDIENLRG